MVALPAAFAFFGINIVGAQAFPEHELLGLFVLRTPGWLYAVMALGLVFVVIPFVWMVLSSFKPDAEVTAIPPTVWPETPTTDNYQQLFTRLDFPTYFANSAIVAVVTAIGNMVFCSMLGYALAKLEFPGKKIVFALVLGTLMFLLLRDSPPYLLARGRDEAARKSAARVLDAPFELIPEGADLSRVGILRIRERERSGHEIAAIEAELDASKLVQADEEQPGDDQERRRDRELTSDQYAAQTSDGNAAGR